MPLIGIDNNWIQDLLLGLGTGIFFIVLNVLNPAIAIGLPIVIFGKELVIGLLAPIGEEAVFRGMIPAGLETFKIPNAAVAVLSATAFMIFHLVAYGASLEAMNGSFIGAFLFGLLTFVLTKYSNSLLPAILTHSIFNLYLNTKLLVAFPA